MKLDTTKRPVPTKQHWHPNGEWKCVCSTSTHAQGQRFTSPQCSYCVRVNSGG